MNEALKELLDLLDLEQIELDIFRGRSPDERIQRVFGGQVAAQALVAAGRTVAETARATRCTPTSSAPGDPTVRSSTTSTGSATAGRSPRAGSRHPARQGDLHHVGVVPHRTRGRRAPGRRCRSARARRALPDVPGADGEAAAIAVRDGSEPRPVDAAVRRRRRRGQAPRRRASARSRVWFRDDAELPDDPLLHVVLARLRLRLDPGRHGAARARRWRGAPPTSAVASLDHAMWFHRPFRADEWLLYAQESPGRAGRADWPRGEMFTRSGELAVSVVQEADPDPRDRNSHENRR